MSDLAKKLLEAGIVSEQTDRLMKMWQGLPTDVDAEIVYARTKEEVLRIVAEIDEMLEKNSEMPELRETELDIAHCFRPDNIVYPVVKINDQLTARIPAAWSRTGKLVIRLGEADYLGEFAIRRGVEFKIDDGDYVFTHVEPRYVGDTLPYYVCDVERVNA